MNNKSHKLSPIALYIGLVVASLLGILIGSIIFIQQERKHTLTHLQANQNNVYTYIKNSYDPEHGFALEQILDHFPTLTFISIKENQRYAFQASRDRNSFWLTAADEYQPRAWEFAYYTQQIDRFTLATPNQGDMRITMVFDLLSPTSAQAITLRALIGVLALMVLSIIMSFFLKKRPQEAGQRASDPVQGSIITPSQAQHELEEIEANYSQDPDIFTAEPSPSFDLGDDPAIADITNPHPEENDDLFSLEEDFSTEDPLPDFSAFDDLDLPEIEPNTLEQSDLSSPSDLNFFDTDAQPDAPQEDLFLSPLEEIEHPSDEPQAILFDLEAPEDFNIDSLPSPLDDLDTLTFPEEESPKTPEEDSPTQGSFLPEDSLLNADLTMPEELEDPTKLLFEEEPLVDTEESLDSIPVLEDPENSEDEFLNQSLDLDNLEEIPLESPIEEEQLNEEPNLGEDNQNPLSTQPSIEPESSAKRAILESMQAMENQPLALILLQEQPTLSSRFDDLLTSYMTKNFPQAPLETLEDGRYALLLHGKSLEESFAMLEELNRAFQGEDLHFSAGLASTQEREGVAPTILWKEAEHALERALNSQENDMLIAFKIDKEKFSSLDIH